MKIVHAGDNDEKMRGFGRDMIILSFINKKRLTKNTTGHIVNAR